MGYVKIKSMRWRHGQRVEALRGTLFPSTSRSREEERETEAGIMHGKATKDYKVERNMCGKQARCKKKNVKTAKERERERQREAG